MEMEMIFLNVFNRSLAAGWLILAVIVVRFLLKKAPRRLSCVLWAVVAVRLLCPFFPASSFSLIPSGETISAEAVRFAPAPAIDSGIPALNEALNPMIGERFAPAPGTSVNPLYIWTAVAGIVWLVGVAVMDMRCSAACGCAAWYGRLCRWSQGLRCRIMYGCVMR